MRNLRRYTVVLGACLVVASAVFSQQRADPYAANPDDPFSISASVSPNADGSFTVHVSVTEKKTGTVVFAPTVTTRPNIQAEVFPDKVQNQPEFEVHITVNAAGKASVTFKAFQNVLQRSNIEAVPESAQQKSK
jgi:hypothetical protein